MADLTTLPGRLKWAQDKAGVDNKTLATRVGVHHVTISQWRTGKQVPPDETLERVAEVLGFPTAWFRYGGELGADAADARTGVSPVGYNPRVSEEQLAELPRQLELMALDFEREAVAAGADRHFLRYARSKLRDPYLAALFAGGHDEKPMSADEQRVEYEAVVEELRRMLKRRLERLAEMETRRR